ncbi:MAG TPA: peptidylprolyl isomerase [Alphaproteobacteria bacterium]|nr:peptidylprolyl isomerase [Alphaproteobacteria bacterium]
MPRALGRCLIAALILALGIVAPGFAPRAQDLQRIVAVVNDEVITEFDLRARLEFIRTTSNLPDSPELVNALVPQVLQALIDEQLQLQEAMARGIEVSEKDMTFAIERIEELNNLPPGTFPSYLEQLGLSVDLALQQVRAQVAWGKVVRARYGDAVSISPDDVEAEVARRRAERGQPIYRLAEIFLAVDSPAREEEVRADAENLITQLHSGASFPGLARQFSQNASASVGGDLGWVRPGQLAPEVAQAVLAMTAGAIAGPIRTVEGYHVLALLERAVSGEADPEGAVLRLAQLVVPVAPDADEAAVERERRRALEIARQVTTCAGLIERARQMQAPLSGDLGELRLQDLPGPIRDAVAELPVARPSAPVRTPDGWHVLMVCDRTEPQAAEQRIDPESVREELAEQRLDQAARRYLRDLRRGAFIDIRL